MLPGEILLLVALYFIGGWRLHGALSAAVLFAPLGIIAFWWSVNYIATSPADSSAVVQRAGLGILKASLAEWFFRWLQFFNGNWIGTRYICERTLLMATEACLLVALAAMAILRKQYLWLFALLWTFLAVAPYVAIVSQEATRLALPVLILGVGGDRFLYYSAAGAALLTVTSAQWFCTEIGHWARRRAWQPWVAVGLVFIGMITLNVHRLIRFESDWDMAGHIGNGVISQTLALVPAPDQGSLLCMANLPDNYNGKYIFRNGIAQALYIAYGRDDFRVRATVQVPHDFREQGSLDTAGCQYVLRYNEASNSLHVQQ